MRLPVTCLTFLLSLIVAISYGNIDWKIGIDPGHGGTDSGAVGPTGLLEKDVNLETALAVERYLVAHGATVVMTRTTDETVSYPERTDSLINSGVDRVISIHHNSASADVNRVMDFVYCGHCLEPARELAYAVLQNLGNSTGLATGSPAAKTNTLCPGRTDWLCEGGDVGQADMHMVREPELHAQIPSVLVEVSFITNPTEEEKLRNACYIDGNGWAIYAGVAEHYGVEPYSQPTQWSSDPSENLPICISAGDQGDPQIASDGLGGVIVAWMDSSNGFPEFDIYAQRVSHSGEILWATDGVPICTAAQVQQWPKLVSDGVGGAIIVWQDARNHPLGYDVDIYAQRVSGDGVVLWPTDGVPVCIADESQTSPQIASDGTGGGIVAWHDTRYDGWGDIYAQRVDSQGNPVWALAGVPISTAPMSQRPLPKVVADGRGGAIIVWQDGRSGEDIYAQRLDSDGTAQWQYDGVPICVADDLQLDPAISVDGYANVIIAWEDWRDRNNGQKSNIYAQRVSADGTMLWDVNGILVCGESSAQGRVAVASDLSGGGIIAWMDARAGSYQDIYAQRVSGQGNTLWDVDGVPVCRASLNQVNPECISDGSGGAIVSWQDERHGNQNPDIYAQRVDAAGVPQWEVDGTAISTAPGYQGTHVSLLSNADAVIFVWGDARNASSDIYAQKINIDGSLGPGDPPPAPDLVIYPEDIEFTNPSTEELGISVWVHNIGCVDAQDVVVEFLANGEMIESQFNPLTIERIRAGSRWVTEEVNWFLDERITEDCRITVRVIDSLPVETNMSNNEVDKLISVYYTKFGDPPTTYDVQVDGYQFWNADVPESDMSEAIKYWGEQNLLSDLHRRLVLAFGDWKDADGVCYGMAASSLLYKVDPDLKPGGGQNTYDMELSDPGVHENIVMYHASQAPFLLELSWLGKLVYDRSPADEYTKAFEQIRNNGLMLQVLGLSNKSSHAVVAYKILDLGDEKRVYVYENNAPGNRDPFVRYIQNEVSYYTGYKYDEIDMVLSRHPATWFLPSDMRPQIEGYISDLYRYFVTSLYDSAKHAFFLGSPADMVIVDEQGRRTGMINGSPINEIPGASIETFGSTQTVYMPESVKYTVETVGYDEGELSLDIITTQPGSETEHIAYEHVPVSVGAKSSVNVDLVNPDFTMLLDSDGDGTPEDTHTPEAPLVIPSVVAGLSVSVDGVLDVVSLAWSPSDHAIAYNI